MTMNPPDYDSIIALNYSGCKALLRSPAHYQAWLTEERKPTPATKFGTMAHLAVFQPKAFNERVVILPEDAPDKPTAAMLAAYAAGSKKQKPETVERIQWWERFNASVPEGAETVSQAEYDHIADVAESAEKAIASIGVDAAVWEVESPLTKDYAGITIKGRPDLVTVSKGKRVVIDLKTTEDASPWAFSSDINKFKYHLQAAFYLELTGADSFVIVAVEKSPPFAWKAYVLDAASLEVGRTLMAAAAATYKECLTFSAWPSYDGSLTEISIPKYALPNQA